MTNTLHTLTEYVRSAATLVCVWLHYAYCFPLFKGSQRQFFVAHYEPVLQIRQRRLSLNATVGSVQCSLMRRVASQYQRLPGLYNHGDAGLAAAPFSLKHTLELRRSVADV